MIKEFVERFDAARQALLEKYKAAHPDGYDEIVRDVVTVCADGATGGVPSTEHIHRIDDGSYQGVLVFVIGEGGDQPSDYWVAKVSYGSCSVCDTFQHIRDYGDEPPTEEQAKDYLTLALHILQNMKALQ